MKRMLVIAAALLATAGAASADGDAAEGEKVFKKCMACHAIGPDAKNKVGPILNGVAGGPIAANAEFKYSKVLADKGAAGETWTDENLAALLKKPADFAKGTKMSFPGLKEEDDIEDVIAYLKTFP